MTNPSGWSWIGTMAIAAWVGWLGPAAAQGIFTCTDSRGKRITSDRPIAECNDREQKELNPSGTLRRNVGPSLTAQERAVEEEREKKAAEEKARANEERRRNRAMLTRYQNQAAHDKERAEALAQVDEVMLAAGKRLTDLKQERVAIDNELEFYKSNPDKVPMKVRRQLQENEQNVAAQLRFIADQESEKKRVNARFDDELARLRVLWAAQATPVAR